MATRIPWTPDEDAQLRAGYERGDTVTALAAAIGRTPGAVAGRAARLGLRSERAWRTEAAALATRADAKALRAQLKLALLEDAERLRQQMWSPAIVFNFGGKDNTYEEREVAEPPTRDKLNLMQAIGVAVDRSIKIDAHDADTGVAEAVGSLDLIAAALEAAAAALPDMGPDQ